MFKNRHNWVKNLTAQAKNKATSAVAFATASSLMLVAPITHAGTEGEEFADLAEMGEGWLEGKLGLAIAMFGLIIGLIVGFMKGTLMPVLYGLGVAIVANILPGIVSAMFTAVI